MGLQDVGFGVQGMQVQGFTVWGFRISRMHLGFTVFGMGVLNGCLGFYVTREKRGTNFYFILVPLRKKVLKSGTPKPRCRAQREKGLHFGVCDFG